MNRKTKLRKFFDSAQTDQAYIQEYEANRTYVEGLISAGHAEDLELFVPYKLFKYADLICSAGRYSQALKLTMEVEDSLKKMRGWKYHKACSDHAKFLKAVCLGRLKKYGESNRVFKELLSEKGDNEKFEDWYRANQKAQVHRVLDPIIYLGLGFHVLVILLSWTGHWDRDNPISELGLLVGLSAFLVSYLLRWWIGRRELSEG